MKCAKCKKSINSGKLILGIGIVCFNCIDAQARKLKGDNK